MRTGRPRRRELRGGAPAASVALLRRLAQSAAPGGQLCRHDNNLRQSIDGLMGDKGPQRDPAPDQAAGRAVERDVFPIDVPGEHAAAAGRRCRRADRTGVNALFGHCTAPRGPRAAGKAGRWSGSERALPAGRWSIIVASYREPLYGFRYDRGAPRVRPASSGSWSGTLHRGAAVFAVFCCGQTMMLMPGVTYESLHQFTPDGPAAATRRLGWARLMVPRASARASNESIVGVVGSDLCDAEAASGTATMVGINGDLDAPGKPDVRAVS